MVTFDPVPVALLLLALLLVVCCCLIVQLSESASELATVNGSSVSAHGALEEPAINIALWNNPAQE